ncbi:hypothetical protein QU617_09855 [Pseudomonas guariconensis]|uniref:hypothetical protein n=1 Tax=Pseudomonas guariconensis TaxID=1288410 RepID=UPI0025A93F82|nr:hypothetical protein [Pseudomonas guariconensis]MDM9593614.1 hypothetical protein [Pseudomonas guariconensis]MDM9606441.1 hypothetical protein [Pseudomonas guariconensis]MDM9611397.1 hypothetical protein [Pseudomonas guariconensis]
MTIDKAKLKALAQAANAVTTDVNVTMAVGSAPEEVKAVQDFLQQAMPKTILALLAEIERLEKFEDWFVRLDQAEQSLSASFKAERDQLKAENEDYKSGQERYEQIIEDLKADNEALRKALGEISGQVDGNIRCAVRDVVNCRGDVQDIYGYCDNIDEIIEAAMAKEASHD